MNLPWALIAQETARQLPTLSECARRLARGHDGEAAALWTRRAQSLASAYAAVGAAPLARIGDALVTAWAPAAGRSDVAARVDGLLALLKALTETPAETAGGWLDRLVQALDALDAPAPKPAGETEPADTRLLALFAAEVEDKAAAIDRHLLQLEQQPDRLELIAPVMRATHSIKGAARAVSHDAAVRLAHALEECLSVAQKRGAAVESALLDVALAAVEQLRRLATDRGSEATAAATALVRQLLDGAAAGERPASTAPADTIATGAGYVVAEDTDPVLRVRASDLGRLIALAGTGMVESRRLRAHADRQLRLRRRLAELARRLDELNQRAGAPPPTTPVGAVLGDVRSEVARARVDLNDWIETFSEYLRGAVELSERTYHAASQTRLRPFADIAAGYPRMVRALARDLGKRARLVVSGEAVAVDRDVLERLDAPLTHLLRNALDHGIEAPDARAATGKPPDGRIDLVASYRGGMLAIDLVDDGAGIDDEAVRAALVAAGRLDAEAAAALAPAQLHEFLFAPGFSTRERVSEISGRGVGLDVVRQLVLQLGGHVRLSSRRGAGTGFHLQVPISRAVTRALAVRVAGEAYAFPLARIEAVLRAPRADVVVGGGAQYLRHGGRNVGLVALAEHLELGATRTEDDGISVVLVALEGRTLGFVVDRIAGEFDLATRPVDARLGRIGDVAAVAALPDGTPVVLLDVDDLMRGAQDASRARLAAVGPAGEATRVEAVLVVDDSISVRELERQLLAAEGYVVDTAIDGMDAWSRLREQRYALVVTDVDMPRMDGIELTRSIKQDPALRHLPVVIVSYRDRAEDRQRGLDARADAYLTKSDFQQQRFVDTVRTLIGPAGARR
jgi:two-component system sensor histidine kinase and response regulator WspE